MTVTMTVEDIQRSSDVDQLWAAFQTARRDGDPAVADAARDRMAALQVERQHDGLDDDQLVARIVALREVVDREPTPDREAELDSLLEEAEHRGTPV